ncbi:hypothetical protein BH09PSE5_BH09PSE5_31510 [soil metagenome]
MEKIVVFVNDAEYARHILEPMLSGEGPTQWVVVACPPTLTRHISRWVSNSAREQWKVRWAAEVFGELEPGLKAKPGSTVERLVAKRPLAELTAKLQVRLGEVRLLDARRHRVGRTEEPLSATQPPAASSNWAYPVAVTSGLSVMLALTD